MCPAPFLVTPRFIKPLQRRGEPAPPSFPHHPSPSPPWSHHTRQEKAGLGEDIPHSLSLMVLARRHGNGPACASPDSVLTCISSHMHAPTMVPAAALIYSLYFRLLDGPHHGCVCRGGLQSCFPMHGWVQVLSRAFKSILSLMT